MPHDPNQWYDADRATFGDRLAGAREAAELSQRDLARHLGVRRETVQNWEDDRAEPRANKLAMMAGLLNVSVGWLLTGRGEGVGAIPGSTGRAAALAVLLSELRHLRADLAGAEARAGTLETRLAAIVDGAEG